MHLNAHQSGSRFDDILSAWFRHFDGYAHFLGGSRQPPIERDEGRIETSGDREVQGVRRSEPQIEAAGIDIGEPSVGWRDVDRRAHRRTPSVKIRQTRRCIGVG